MAELTLRTLSEDQTRSFDVEYVDDDLWRLLSARLEGRLDRPDSTALDVGGGNGVFVDRILETFPEARVTNIEPASNLAARNRSHPRKRVVGDTFQNAVLDIAEKFDVIFFNWVLHHFVVSGYRNTRDCQVDALRHAQVMLRDNGVVAIFENLYSGNTIDNLPSRIIYELTRSRALKGVTSRLGANTAGVGVCFHSQAGWRQLLDEAGFEIESVTPCYSYGALSPLKRGLLHLRDSRVALIIARPRR